MTERVEYRNSDNSSLKDYFQFEVRIGDVKVNSEFQINATTKYMSIFHLQIRYTKKVHANNMII